MCDNSIFWPNVTLTVFYVKSEMRPIFRWHSNIGHQPPTTADAVFYLWYSLVLVSSVCRLVLCGSRQRSLAVIGWGEKVMWSKIDFTTVGKHIIDWENFIQLLFLYTICYFGESADSTTTGKTFFHENYLKKKNFYNCFVSIYESPLLLQEVKLYVVHMVGMHSGGISVSCV